MIRTAIAIVLVLVGLGSLALGVYSYDRYGEWVGYERKQGTEKTPTVGDWGIWTSCGYGRWRIHHAVDLQATLSRATDVGPWAGFRYTVLVRNVGGGLTREIRILQIPLWLVTVLGLWYPVSLIMRGPCLRYVRRRRGRCLNCGYNLTGNESGVCPECGKPIGYTECGDLV